MTRIRVGTAAVLALLVVATGAGCEASRVDRHASVALHGSVHRPDGSAAGAIQVGLTRVPDPAEILFQGLATVGTFGLACLGKESLPICKTAQRRTTDGNGGYRFAMKGSDVQGMFGEASTFSLAGALPAGRGQIAGPGVSSDFHVQQTDLAMPTFTFWQPSHVTATPDGRHRLTVRWSRFEVPGAGTPSSYLAQFNQGAAQVWSQSVAPGDTVDGRAVEDTGASVGVDATVSRKGSGTTFHTTYATQRVGSGDPGVGAPESRGAACVVQGASGPVPLSPCTLTDGQFNASFPTQHCPGTGEPSGTPSPSPSADHCTANSSVYLDLGADKPVGTVFVHGLSAGDVIVDTSDDASHWTTRAQGDPGSYGTLTPPSVTHARYVRLRSADAGSIAALTELSVWPTR